MKIPVIPVVVLPCPSENIVDEAKLQLMAAAAVLHKQAAEALAQGLYLQGQSARMEMLGEGLDDEDIVNVRDKLVAEGVLQIDTTWTTSAPGGQA